MSSQDLCPIETCVGFFSGFCCFLGSGGFHAVIHSQDVWAKDDAVPAKQFETLLVSNFEG